MADKLWKKLEPLLNGGATVCFSKGNAVVNLDLNQPEQETAVQQDLQSVLPTSITVEVARNPASAGTLTMPGGGGYVAMELRVPVGVGQKEFLKLIQNARLSIHVGERQFEVPKDSRIMHRGKVKTLELRPKE